MQKNDKELIVQAATKTHRRDKGLARMFYGMAGLFSLVTGVVYAPGHSLTSSSISAFLPHSTMAFFAVLWFLVALICLSGVVSIRAQKIAAPALTGMIAVLVALYFTQWVWGDEIITVASVKNYLFMWISSYVAVAALSNEKE